MPDHVHVLVEGTTGGASLSGYVRRWKQVTGYRVARERGFRLWQPGFFDRVLRENESTQTVARYILENPVRSGEADRVGEHPFTWCIWEHEAEFWD